VGPRIPPNFKRHHQDAEKRINILFDHLNNEDLLSLDTVKEMVVLSEALGRGEYDTAHAYALDLLTSRSEECTTWMTGVKRLIEMSRATQ
jgi:protein transport protein SEC31